MNVLAMWPLFFNSGWIDEPHERAIVMSLIGLATWALKVQHERMKERAAGRKLGAKLNGSSDRSLTGKEARNPTSTKLLDLVYEELKEFRREADKIHREHAEKLGELRGRHKGGRG